MKRIIASPVFVVARETDMYRIRIWQFVGMVLALLGFVQAVPAQGRLNWSHLMPPSPVPSPRLVEGYGKLPLSFEANGGQTDWRVKFLSRGPGYSLFLTGDEAVVALRQGRPKLGSQKQGEENFFSTPGAFHGLFDLSPVGSSDKSELNAQDPTLNPEPQPPAVIRMKLLGGNLKAKVEGLDELPGKGNYFIGNDPKNWRTNLTTYAKVKYHDVYPGIDLVYYGNQGGQLEYDFVIAPGADPKAIALQVQIGNSKLESREYKIDANGDLVVQLDGGEIRFHKPAIYQEQSLVASGEGAASAGNRQSSTDNRRLVDGRFVLLADNRVGFEVASYDKSKPIVIDPTLLYSTYLGGSGGDSGTSVAVDSSGNAYVTGNAGSTNFPTTPGAYQTSSPGVFVAKLNSAGTALLYSTILGPGNAGTCSGCPVNFSGVDIAVDSSGSAYVTGVTNSANFPTTPGTFQSSQPPSSCYGYAPFYCGWTAFVTKLNAAGSGLVYSTYLGGGNEWNSTIAVDSLGNAYLEGTTNATGFPTMNPIQGFTPGGGDVFATKLDATGSHLLYSTYLGGPTGCCAYGNIGEGIALDSSGNAYLTGYTSSTGFPTVNPIQGTLKGAFNTFVSKLNATGNALVYSTYLGGSGQDLGAGVTVDSSGNAYVTGATTSSDFPTTPAAFQRTLNGPYNVFVTKVNAAGSALAYSTYLGGAGTDGGFGIALDSAGKAYVTGAARSADFPTMNPIQPANNGGADAFVTSLDAAGSAILFSTYLGGSDTDVAQGIAVDSSGSIYVTGYTASGDFPTTSGAVQTTYGGGNTDAFVAKIIDFAFPSSGSFVIGDLDAAVGNTVTFWGAHWAKANSLSGGPAPNAFKGFTDTAPKTCGGSWTSDAGNSSNPPDSVPSFMAVIVSSSVTKSGATISGDVPKIVIVQTNPGYRPDPGHTGTGTVVAVLCGS